MSLLLDLFLLYHALAWTGIEVCVCNSAHMRNVPGRKRDVTGFQWIAELNEYGLLRHAGMAGARSTSALLGSLWASSRSAHPGG